jgi:hypothetical protein
MKLHATYYLTRAIIEENKTPPLANHPPENLGVVAGSLAGEGCGTIAFGIVAIAETLTLPIALLADGSRFAYSKLRRK